MAARLVPSSIFVVLAWIVLRTVRRVEVLEALQEVDRRTLGKIKKALWSRFSIHITDDDGSTTNGDAGGIGRIGSS